MNHLSLYFFMFSNQRCILLSTVNDIDSSFTDPNDSILTNLLLFGKASLDISANTLTLMNYNYELYHINEQI